MGSDLELPPRFPEVVSLANICSASIGCFKEYSHVTSIIPSFSAYCFYSNAFLEPTGSTLRTLTKSPHFFTEVDPMSGSVVEETKALELWVDTSCCCTIKLSAMAGQPTPPWATLPPPERRSSIAGLIKGNLMVNKPFIEQWAMEKGPQVVSCVYRGWNTTQLYRVYNKPLLLDPY